jgi:predicted metal-binding protein
LPSCPKEVDASNNFLRMIRFFERAIVTKVARLVGCSGGSGSQDYVNVRVMRTNPVGETETIHLAAQPNLRKDNVDRLSGTQHGHNVSGRDALENLVSAVAQIAGDDHPDQDVGLHDQNRAWWRAVSALVI